MKTTSKLLVVAVLAAGTIASSANAGSSQVQQRIARENFEYFQAKGNVGSGSVITPNPDYVHLVTPQQRMAARSQEYFAKIGYKGGEVKPFNRYTDVSEYPFSGSVLSAERGGYVWSSARK